MCCPSVAKLKDMFVMHCMTNAVLEYHFYLKVHQQIVLQKEAICAIIRFIATSRLILSLLMTCINVTKDNWLITHTS